MRDIDFIPFGLVLLFAANVGFGVATGHWFSWAAAAGAAGVLWVIEE